MDISQTIREKIYRFPVIHKLLRYMRYNCGYFRYIILYKKLNLSNRFINLKSNRKSDRCFIIGCGPSLEAKDLDKLMSEDCMSSNHIYRIFDKTNWRPKYYFVQDAYLDEVIVKKIQSFNIENILVGEALWHSRDFSSIADRVIVAYGRYYINSNKNHFSDNVEKFYVLSETVSYFAMQTAVYLGYKEIVLLGFDNSYKYEIDNDGKIIDTGQKQAHFFNNEINGQRSIVANTNGMTKSYLAFKEYADEHGIKVYNATRGGKLEVFPRIDFDSLFANN